MREGEGWQGALTGVRLLLIFHRCWRNGIDNAFPSFETLVWCFRNSKFACSCRATLERLGK